MAANIAEDCLSQANSQEIAMLMTGAPVHHKAIGPYRYLGTDGEEELQEMRLSVLSPFT